PAARLFRTRHAPLARAEHASRALPGERRRADQRRRDLPRRLARGKLGRARHRCRKAETVRTLVAYAARPAGGGHIVPALGAGRPRAAQAMGQRPRDPSGRRRASDAADAGARSGRRTRGCDRRRAPSRASRRSRRRLPLLRSRARGTHGASAARRAVQCPHLSRARPLALGARPQAALGRRAPDRPQRLDVSLPAELSQRPKRTETSPSGSSTKRIALSFASIGSGGTTEPQITRSPARSVSPNAARYSATCAISTRGSPGRAITSLAAAASDSSR